MGVPISNVTRRVVYAASGTGPYAFTFEILANTDIAVYRDDTLLTLTTDYSVTIASNGTGSITLVAAPTGATQIAIVGNRTIQRTTDFVTGGDFFANTVNNEMDQQTIFAQQNAEGLQRALSAPQTDPTSINMTLPRASLRAGKALGFDANGNPAIADTLGTNRGNWASGTLYYIRDIVKDTTNNNIWQCLVVHTSSGSQPINTNADSAKWTLLVDAASATTSATNAASSASAAATSASNAASSASAASTSASNASTSASNASSSASAAASSATSAAASYDSFDDRYLGAKSSDPTLDNDSNALIDGALYFDTTNNVMKVYDLGNTIWKRTTPTTSDQANIDSAVANATNINTVATNIANVNNVGGSIANVNTVAGSIASVNTNASNIANINQNAANITAIQNASANATSAAASATTATTQATAAAASAAAASAVVLGNEPVRPDIRPSLLLDFANTKQLDPRITFTRASTATFYGTQTAKAEENLLLQSQDFTTTWTNTGTTDTANTSVAPDGTTTADTLTASAGTSAHNIIQTATFLATPTVFSVFAKAGTHPYIQLRFGAPAGSGFCNFDITSGAGAVGTSGSGATGTITNVGSGWYRCSIVVTPTASSTVVAVFLVSSNSAASGESWTTAGTETVILWGAQLEQRSAVSAYTATTTQPITNYIPVLQTAASGVPRFEHNPNTFESLGLEIEEQRTNLLTYSEDWSNAVWTGGTTTSVTTNTLIAPDGTLTADKIIPDTDVETHLRQQTFSGFTASTVYTFSVYAKAGEWSTLQIYPASAAFSGLPYANFQLTTGTVNVGGGATATMTAVGNGWYRCIMTATASTTASANCVFAVYNTANPSRAATVAGDGYSGIFIWGAQIEVGAFATSYIPTVASQVTRAADAASMTGTNFSSWYNQAEGTVYSEALSFGTGFPYVWGLSSVAGALTDYMTLQVRVSSNLGRFETEYGNVNQTNIDTTISTGTNNKNASTYKFNDFASCANQGTVQTDASALVPLVDRFIIGASYSATGFVNGTIRKIAYYPLRVTNAQLQSLTTV